MSITGPLLPGIFKVTAGAGGGLSPEVLVDVGEGGGGDSLPGGYSWAQWLLCIITTPEQPVLLAEEGGPRGAMVAGRGWASRAGPARDEAAHAAHGWSVRGCGGLRGRFQGHRSCVHNGHGSRGSGLAKGLPGNPAPPAPSLRLLLLLQRGHFLAADPPAAPQSPIPAPGSARRPGRPGGAGRGGAAKAAPPTLEGSGLPTPPRQPALCPALRRLDGGPRLPLWPLICSLQDADRD